MKISLAFLKLLHEHGWTDRTTDMLKLIGAYLYLLVTDVLKKE
jgi:hypothetical protein